MARNGKGVCKLVAPGGRSAKGQREGSEGRGGEKEKESSKKDEIVRSEEEPGGGGMMAAAVC